MKRIRILIASLAFGMAAISPLQADEPTTPVYRIVPKIGAKETTAIALNAKGDLLCYRWAEENGNTDVLEQAPLLLKADSGKSIRIPLLKGYTATMPASLSDSGVVVGRSSRPPVDNAGRLVPLSGVAFVWDEHSGIRSIGALPGDTMSQADSISADGSRISGISIGPDRIRACVWERSGENWEMKPLPQATNRLNSQKAVMSRSGKYVASFEDRKPTLWTREDDGSWRRETIGATDSLIPRAVNDNAVVAGYRINADALSTKDAVIWKRETGVKVLERPKGYLYAELNSINNRNVAVGFADGPHGSSIGPNACVSEGGRLLIFDAEPEFSSATAINDQGQAAGTFEAKEAIDADPENDAPRSGRVAPKR